jgi:hypothetical protein
MLAKNIRRGISVLSVARPDRDTESILAMADKHSETTFFYLVHTIFPTNEKGRF